MYVIFLWYGFMVWISYHTYGVLPCACSNSRVKCLLVFLGCFYGDYLERKYTVVDSMVWNAKLIFLTAGNTLIRCVYAPSGSPEVILAAVVQM